MIDRPAPVLVYDRLAANRRHILLLLAAFTALLLPLVCGAAVYLSFFAFIVTTTDKPVALADPFRLETSAQIIVFLSMTLPLAAVIACVAHLYSSLSRLPQLGPVRREQEPDLWRTIENLCIGAGLPPPALYVIETAAPNAFVTGHDPKHASLVVTRGLLRLLDRRELAGVLAHGLSHIGNRDTALNTLLATIVRTISLPVTLVKGLNPWGLPDLSLGLGVLFLLPALYGIVFFGVLVLSFVLSGFDHGATARHWIAALTPVYALLIAPGAARLLRKTMSKERACLADADGVLLTRDPEGLALALAKIGAAEGAPMQTDPVIAQMYFVDPTAASRGRVSSSHPGIDARIDLLAKMGDGIPESELARAVAAGIRYREADTTRQGGHHPARATDSAFNEHTLSGTRFRLTDPATPLYENADGWSKAIAQLSAGTVVTFNELIGHFACVSCDGTIGYVACSAGADSLPPAVHTAQATDDDA